MHVFLQPPPLHDGRGHKGLLDARLVEPLLCVPAPVGEGPAIQDPVPQKKVSLEYFLSKLLNLWWGESGDVDELM